MKKAILYFWFVVRGRNALEKREDTVVKNEVEDKHKSKHSKKRLGDSKKSIQKK